jgi:hypothetical protein
VFAGNNAQPNPGRYCPSQDLAPIANDMVGNCPADRFACVTMDLRKNTALDPSGISFVDHSISQAVSHTLFRGHEGISFHTFIEDYTQWIHKYKKIDHKH